jgi:hypothetical protein
MPRDLPVTRQAGWSFPRRPATVGGRIHDAHIGEVARVAKAAVILTDNRRHFVAALRHGVRVETPPAFLGRIKRIVE